MGYHLDKAINRLTAITNNYGENNNLQKESHHVLASEFFRRVNAFIETSHAQVETYPIFSVAKALGKKTNIDLFNLCPQIRGINHLYVKAVCYGYLELSVLADESDREAKDHIEIYEPMIKLLERNGSFNIRQGELVVGRSSYPIDYWRNLNVSSSDISDDNLDRLDSN
ncbi:hypothetical protein M3231_18480 [Neobacillus mesonae]|nr:hypothetical protein [Neobacillus mesonae]